jgi:predicted short-subunit dehydrogenase-like oxidoreductase (DUF2520 family)
VTENRLNFFVVGDNAAATTIALCLTQARHRPTGIEAADLVVFAVDANELESKIQNFVSEGLITPGQLVAHILPNFGYRVLDEATKIGAIPLAIHPAMIFTGTSLDLNRIQECRIAISAPAIALPIAEALALELGGEPVVVSEDAREAYAEGFAVAADFSALVVNQAIGLMESAGIVDAKEVVGPLIRGAIDSAIARGHHELDPQDVGE